MRKINIKELKKNLSRELQDLPFEITKYGQVVAVMYKGSHNSVKESFSSVENTVKGSHNDENKQNPVELVKSQLVGIVKKKKKVTTNKAAISMGTTPWVNPLSGSALAPKI